MAGKTPKTAAASLEDALWASANQLRSSMDAAEYKHVVLGLITSRLRCTGGAGGWLCAAAPLRGQFATAERCAARPVKAVSRRSGQE